MSVMLRPYSGWHDLHGMRRVLAEGLRDRPDRSNAHPGDVSWWVGWPPHTASEMERRCVIWQEDRAVLGWAMSDEGDVGEFVHPALLDSARGEEFWGAVDVWLAREHPDSIRYAFAADTAACARLAAAGYDRPGTR